MRSAREGIDRGRRRLLTQGAVAAGAAVLGLTALGCSDDDDARGDDGGGDPGAGGSDATTTTTGPEADDPTTLSAADFAALAPAC